MKSAVALQGPDFLMPGQRTREFAVSWQYPISIPPEALMRVRFIRPGNMAQAITTQLQPVASELVAALREAAAAERGRSRTGERP